MEQSSDAVGSEVAKLGLALLRNSGPLAETMAEQMRAAVPIYRSDLITEDQLRLTCFDNLHFVFEAIGRVAPVDSPESRENGRQRARTGIPLTDVMAAYRIGARFMWNSLAGEAAASPREVIIRAAAEMWQVLDVYTQDMATGYRDEIAFQVATNANERGALVQAVLEGGVPDANIWDAAHTLKIPLSGTYVAVVASVSEMGKQPLLGVQRRLASIGLKSIWQLHPDAETGLVCLRNGSTDTTSVIAELHSSLATRIGISPNFSDLREVKASVRLARLAMHAAGDSRRIVTYEGEPLSILAAGLPEVMEQLAQPILAGLSTMPAREKAMLLTTFGAWRDNGGSADRAAGVLFCHPNTIRHRLHRLEQLTGRSLSDPKSTMELGLAYEYVMSRSNSQPQPV